MSARIVYCPAPKKSKFDHKVAVDVEATVCFTNQEETACGVMFDNAATTSYAILTVIVAIGILALVAVTVIVVKVPF